LVWSATALACEQEAELPEARLSDPAAIARGRELFVEYCAICHGVRGDGHGQRRRYLTDAPPDFRSARWRTSKTPIEIYSVVHDGRAGTSMPSWSHLGRDRLIDLTAAVLAFGGPPDH
jgi:mono/diheme cytochrome c family protein